MTRFVTITGPRDVGELPIDVVQERFADYVGPFATAESHFFLGGAAGIDTLALDRLAATPPRNSPSWRPSGSPTSLRWPARRWRGGGLPTGWPRSSSSARPSSAAYHARNRWMVDRSSLVIGFPHGTDPASGTWYAQNYAAEQGKTGMVVPL